MASRYFLTIVCVYALTLLGGVTYWNCFGFDRSAAAFYFAAPLSIAQVLVAKNIVSLIFIYLEVGYWAGSRWCCAWESAGRRSPRLWW
jgi:hypothetical protein